MAFTDRIKNIRGLDRILADWQSGTSDSLDGVAVLTYGEIAEFTPLRRGQPRKAVCSALGSDTSVYSTNRLERALAEGYDVWVVLSRHELQRFDDWWIELLPRDRVLTLQKRSSELIEPWFFLLVTLLCELDPDSRMPDDELHHIETIEDVRDVLENHGVTFADLLDRNLKRNG